MKILQVISEYYGLMKTGGLADMVASLSHALSRQNLDIRVCLPAYRGTIKQLEQISRTGTITVNEYSFNVIEGRMATTGQVIILLDCPELFDRAGDPYRDQDGREFSDNGQRFGCFCLAVTQLALEGINSWQPDIVHLHDWHTGLIPPLLASNQAPVKTVFTIHNFSFHGIFERQVFDDLKLPARWWQPDELEFHGRFSFMKAALRHSDAITVVSKRYATEIGTHEFGCGLEGVVHQQSERIYGIVNGIDEDEWNPATDRNIAQNYCASSVAAGKRANKATAQKLLGLPPSKLPLIIFIGRLAEQKGPDLLLEAGQRIAELPVQLAVLGSGEKHLEQAFSDWAAAAPQQLAARLEVNEPLAHLLTAAADVQLMPSRFEPCGLSQMYAQRYGTLPIARSTGGLADTIVDATPESLAQKTATGFLFPNADVNSLMEGVERALTLLEQESLTEQVRKSAMACDFSWNTSAHHYLDIYQTLTHRRQQKPRRVNNRQTKASQT